MFFDKIPVSKEPNDEVGDNSSDNNIDTFVTLESASKKNDKDGAIQVEKDVTDMLFANESTSEGSGYNKSILDATATIGSPDEADKMKKDKNVVINDTNSESEGEDF
nr:hypothetical protein [Tanacetum cinerariifolium]